MGRSMIKVETDDSFYTECPVCHADGDTLRVSENLKKRSIEMKCAQCGAVETHVCCELGTSQDRLVLESVMEVHARRAKRPPLGVEPRYVWEEARRQKLRRAITAYMAEDLMVPECWIEEWNELTSGGRVDLIDERLED